MKYLLFNYWLEIKYIKDIVINLFIEVGEYFYYLGYYSY